MSEQFLTISEAAELLRIGERTLYTLAREGKLPAMKIGNQWRVSREALEEWGRVGGEAPVPVSAKKSRRRR